MKVPQAALRRMDADDAYQEHLLDEPTARGFAARCLVSGPLVRTRAAKRIQDLIRP